MNILLIEDDNEARNLLHTILERRFNVAGQKINIVMRALLQDGIELLEKQDQLFDLIIFAYAGTGQALVRCLLDMGGPTSYVMCSPDRTSFTAFAKPGLALETAVRTELKKSFPEALDRLEAKRPFSQSPTPEGDFVPVQAETLIGVSPVRCDVFIKLAQDRMLKLIRKGDEFSPDDLKKYRETRKVDLLYIRRDQADGLLDRQVEQVMKVSQEPINEAEAERVTEASLEAMAELVERMGFTPKAQQLAKASVDVTLKIIGTRPKLAVILSRLKQDQGKYITAHSLTLGKLCCALAYKVGWNSAATYLKLTLAAFLHDLPLRNNALAECDTLEEAKSRGFSPEDIQNLKLHPIRAAEYARQFNEIPADVDQILMQHHEKPDATGYPRSLGHKYIAPLACLFIIAHDLLRFTNANPNATLEEFFTATEAKYSAGTFKKLFKQLREEAPTAT